MNQESLSLESEKPKIKKPRKLSVMQQVVRKHVSGMEGNFNPHDWKQQAKIFSTLSKKYGSEFLLWCPPPENFKVTTLSLYLSAFGKNYLSDQLFEYAKSKGVQPKNNQEVVLSATKIGEDIVVSHKPKTLKEFLNYGKEIRNNPADSKVTS